MNRITPLRLIGAALALGALGGVAVANQPWSDR